MERFDDFQSACQRTSGLSDRPAGQPLSPDCLTMFLGLAGESGEICDMAKKTVGHHHAYHPAKFREELGDLLFYVSEVARLCGLSLSDVAQGNVDKLAKRYPHGFSPADSQARVDTL